MKTILVADDEEDLRLLLSMTLADPGYRIVEASDGDSALDLIQTEQPDVVILDWMMPKKSGLEVAKAIRQDPSIQHIPIIMLTARDQHADLKEGEMVKAFAYLVKPFSPLQLLDKVHLALAQVKTP